jgi:hypothetical protein
MVLEEDSQHSRCELDLYTRAELMYDGPMVALIRSQAVMTVNMGDMLREPLRTNAVYTIDARGNRV